MRKVYNYRNTSDINCVVKNGPIGFVYDDYPEIAEKRHNHRQNPITDRTFRLDGYDVSDYLLNVSFEEAKLKFEVNGSGNITNVHRFIAFKWYHHVIEDRIYRYSRREGSSFFSYNGELTSKGKRLLVPVTIRCLGFATDISDISSMEFIDKWWKSHIYINLKFKTGLEPLELQFNKEDRDDAQFVVDEINTIRRIIQSKEQEEILSRWEDEQSELQEIS